jgi:malonate transporter and related proteins
LGLNPIPDKMLSMLADASVPTALFALGVSLAAYSLKGAWDGMFTLIGLKMILMPLLVFILSDYVFHLQPLWAKIAVMFAAMPTGANAFLFAQRNDEAVPAVSGAIAAGTAFAAISASVLLYLMDLGTI